MSLLFYLRRYVTRRGGAELSLRAASLPSGPHSAGVPASAGLATVSPAQGAVVTALSTEPASPASASNRPAGKAPASASRRRPAAGADGYPPRQLTALEGPAARRQRPGVAQRSTHRPAPGRGPR